MADANVNSLRVQIQALTELLQLKNQQEKGNASPVELYRRKLFQLLLTGKLQNSEIEDLRERLYKLAGQLATAENSLLRRVDEIEELKEENNGLQATIYNLNNELQGKSIVVDEYLSQLKAMEAAIDELKSTNNDIEIEAKTSAVLSVQKMSELQGELEDAREAIRELQVKLAALTTSKQQKQLAHQQLTDSLQKEQQSFSQLQRQLQQERSNKAILAEQLSMAQQLRAQAEQHHLQEISRLNAETASTHSAKEAAVGQCEAVRRLLLESQSQLRDAATKHSESQELVAKLEKEMKSQLTKVAALTKEIEYATTQLREAQTKNREFENATRLTREALNGLKAELQLVREQHEQIGRSKSSVEKQLKEVKRQLEEAETENLRLIADAQKCSKQSTKKDSYAESLKSQVLQLDAINKDLKTREAEATTLVLQLKQRQKAEWSAAIIESETVRNQNAQLLHLIDYKEKEFLRILAEAGFSTAGQPWMPLQRTAPVSANLLNTGLPIITPKRTERVYPHTRPENASRWLEDASKMG